MLDQQVWIRAQSHIDWLISVEHVTEDEFGIIVFLKLTVVMEDKNEYKPKKITKMWSG